VTGDSQSTKTVRFIAKNYSVEAILVANTPKTNNIAEK